MNHTKYGTLPSKHIIYILRKIWDQCKWDDGALKKCFLFLYPQLMDRRTHVYRWAYKNREKIQNRFGNVHLSVRPSVYLALWMCISRLSIQPPFHISVCLPAAWTLTSAKITGYVWVQQAKYTTFNRFNISLEVFITIMCKFNLKSL